MISNLKPHAAYKGSGVPWLGKVPEHWEGRRCRESEGLLSGITGGGIEWA